ncbi:ABC transporter ATP-binding protein [Kaistia geumhonensis]|uniref:ATP-binding cassette subfamily B protein n=1 Tax=Kaistia geumhonensis TaxID=410839 RepID=A0ABU0M200_9HYPH|nr:ABC transporter ATP-binding protein [Kaistia geumhonensis]MCX5479898.1 ABC transporter ATP-binding protein [Kaistia geumhonensis]MDQ0514875.1 ATP-binding cassette subfamily B protein [Kaistia geumhonensis]
MAITAQARSPRRWLSGPFARVFAFTFRHWRRQKFVAAFIMVAMLLETLAHVLLPLYAGRIVDAIASPAAVRDQALGLAIEAFATVMVLSAGMVVARHIAFTGIIRLTLAIMSDVASEAFYRVQRFSTNWQANSFAGSTVRKISRGMWALDQLNDTMILALLPSVVVLVGTTILLGAYWPMMGVIVAVGSIIYVAVTVSLSLFYVAPAASLANQWDTKLGGALADAVSCNAVVKAFGAEAREDQRLAGIIAKWRGRTRRTWARGTNNGTAQNAMVVILRGAVVGLVLWLWWHGRATPGDVTFVLTSFFVLEGYLLDVGMHVRNLQRAVNDMEELVSLESQPLGIEDKADAVPMKIGAGEIRFDDVTFHYAGHDTPLYRDFNVTIAAGEKIGLVGHSGSGKTTFVKLIQRLYDVNKGRILIDGQDIAHVTQSSLRGEIAIVQQEPILFHRSLAENIAYARPGASMDEIVAAAKLANAHHFIERLPRAYQTLVGERGVKLSGGERQRVALARAFLADAPVLILDEATSSLDSESEALIQEAMERLMEGRTAIVIAHRLSTVRSMDRLLVFDHGTIAEEGTHDVLVRRENGIYRRLFERQALELAKGLEIAA